MTHEPDRTLWPAGRHRHAACLRGAGQPLGRAPLPDTEKPVGAWRAYYEQWPSALRRQQDRLWEPVDELATHTRHLVDATPFGTWTPEPAERVGPAGRLVLAESARTAVRCVVDLYRPLIRVVTVAEVLAGDP